MDSLESDNSEKVKKISRDIIQYLINHPETTRGKITNIKGRIGKNYKYNKVIKNATILDYATSEEKKIITQILKRRKTSFIRKKKENTGKKSLQAGSRILFYMKSRI